jgi:hypothetical protein
MKEDKKKIFSDPGKTTDGEDTQIPNKSDPVNKTDSALPLTRTLFQLGLPGD